MVCLILPWTWRVLSSPKAWHILLSYWAGWPALPGWGWSLNSRCIPSHWAFYWPKVRERILIETNVAGGLGDRWLANHNTCNYFTLACCYNHRNFYCTLWSHTNVYQGPVRVVVQGQQYLFSAFYFHVQAFSTKSWKNSIIAKFVENANIARAKQW